MQSSSRAGCGIPCPLPESVLSENSAKGGASGMTMNVQTAFFCGRPSHCSVVAVPRHKYLLIHQNHEFLHRLAAGMSEDSQYCKSILASSSGVVRQLAMPLKKSGLASRSIRCSSTEPGQKHGHDVSVEKPKSKPTVKEIMQTVLQKANSSIGYAVVATTLLAFVYPPSFTWFTTRYYAPALGFLMFAVGLNLNAQAFLHAVERPAVIAAGYGGQFVVKPLLGLLTSYIAVSLLHLPSAIGSGLILVSCVSGAQLSNYATFMFDQSMTPLSIVMTALSTITAVVVTPALSLLLLRKRLPVNVAGMMASITQIVVVPIAGGLALNKFLPSVSSWIRPFLPLSSIFVTCCCVGAPLALNAKAVGTQFGLLLLLALVIFHSLAFISGYQMTKLFFPSEPDVEQLAKTISLETGMQSSLLAFSLANTFYPDPLVALPAAISTVLMTLMGMGLAVFWQHGQKPAAK